MIEKEYFAVSRMRFGAEKLKGVLADIDAFMVDYTNALREPANGTLLSLEKIGTGTPPQYEYKIQEVSDFPSIHHGRVTIVNGKLYDVKVITLTLGGSEPNKQRIIEFLDSFSLQESK